MKRLLFGVLCLYLFGCAPIPTNPPNPILDSSADTVAFVVSDGETPPKYHPFCAGVWVADEWILTANHCTIDNRGAEVGIEPIEMRDISYIMNAEGKYRYEGKVVYRDKANDLALLSSKTYLIHRYVKVSRETPEVGTNVHAIGHPRGMLWTYLKGMIAGTKRSDGGQTNTPFLQVQIPIAPGMSGGGLFDDEGQLVGIADWGMTSMPGQGFYVPAEAINKFLKESHL